MQGTTANRWRVTAQIWVVLLIGWSKLLTNQKHYTVLGSDASSVRNLACPRLPYSLSPSPNAVLVYFFAIRLTNYFGPSFRGETSGGVGKYRLFFSGFVHTMLDSSSFCVRYSVNNNAAELGQVVHTYRTTRRSGWPRGVWWTKSQSSFRNIYFRLSGFQASFLFFHFRYGPNTCSHCTKCATEPIRYVTLLAFETGAALRSVAEIAPKSPFLCVNRSTIRYGFRSGVKASRYSVNIDSG